MIYLDYRDCGKDGEPKVSICIQEDDFEIIILADNFEEFILGLRAVSVNSSTPPHKYTSTIK